MSTIQIVCIGGGDYVTRKGQMSFMTLNVFINVRDDLIHVIIISM